jgi:lysozyme
VAKILELVLMRAKVAGLVISAAAFVGILNYEKFVPETYSDVGGVNTIGFGTTKGVQAGQKITVERALIQALSDAERMSAEMRVCIKVPLYQHEFDAFVSLTYNIGPQAFCSSTLVRKLNDGDYDGACREILKWNKVGNDVVKGLVIRRGKEYDLCIGKQ